MKKKFVWLLLILLFASNVFAQKTTPLRTDNSNTALTVTFGCEGTNCAGLTVDATAGGVVLTAANYNPVVVDQPSGFSQAQRADCFNTGAKIWVTSNSAITLSSGKGRAVGDGGTFTIFGFTEIKNFKVIRDAAVSSTLYCDYSRQP